MCYNMTESLQGHTCPEIQLDGKDVHTQGLNTCTYIAPVKQKSSEALAAE